jgi:hypothetical protein
MLKFYTLFPVAIEEDSNTLINWISANKMRANPEKFQAISVGRKTHDKNVMKVLRMCLGCSVLFRALYCFQSESSTPC